MRPMKPPIELDGSQGEGGGQILRSALALSMITGQPFRIQNIRANRSKPGLMRQHLVALQAAAHVSGAEVSGAALGSAALSFTPGGIRGGTYEFPIGTAGSTTLVLQTLIPALLHAEAPSTVLVSGGTHNPMAPPVQFLQRAYRRVLADVGAHIDIQARRYGFYPAGGGEVVLTLQPCRQWRVLELMEPGPLRAGYAEGFVAALPADIARRELDCVRASLGWSEPQLLLHELAREQGPGNALVITLDNEHVTEVFSGVGARAVRAETVAETALAELKAYARSGAALGEHLADQILLPMALAGGGRFTTSRLTQHAITNADVIARFLPVDIRFEQGKNLTICTVGKSSVPA